MNCEFCGAVLSPRIYQVLGKDISFGHEDCKCEKAIINKQEKERQKYEREEKEKEQKLLAKFQAADIPKMYLGAQSAMASKMSAEVKEGKGFYIYGANGTGKSYTAYAIARECIVGGVSVMCTTAADFMSLNREFSKSAQRQHELLMNCSVVIMDDLGKESPTAYACERLFHLIDKRYSACKPTIITSNYSLQDMAERLGHGAVGISIASRLTQVSKVIALNGVDKRIVR